MNVLLFMLPMGLALFFSPIASAVSTCPKCVLGDFAVEKELLQLSALAPAEQLAWVRKSGTCVQILQSERKVPRNLFTWGQIESSSAPLNSVTQQKNLVGKTFCKGEQPISKTCTTIVLASDAPRSTLLHEYLHVKQIEKDPSWCTLSKTLWARKPTTAESQIIRNKEWDVHRLLWIKRQELHFATEDELAVTSETLDEATLRSPFDPDAARFVAAEKLNAHLNEVIAKYKLELAAPKSAINNIDGIATTTTGKKKFWKSLPLRLCVPSEAPGQLQKQIEEAAKIWNESFAKPIFKLDCPDTQPEVAIQWIPKDFSRYGDPTVAARTLSDASNESGEFLDAVILFNADTFDWKSGKIDLTTVALHELGHAMGLEHNPLWTDSAMATIPYQSGVRIRKLGTYESTTIGRAYFAGKLSLPGYLQAYLNNDLSEAAGLLTKTASRSVEEEYALALIEKSQKKNESALGHFNTVVQKDPNHLRAMYELADTYWANNQESEAVRWFNAVLTKNPDYYEALANLGSISMNQGKTQEAQKYFEKTFAINPVHYFACYFLFQIKPEDQYKNCVIKYSNDDEMIKAVSGK